MMQILCLKNNVHVSVNVFFKFVIDCVCVTCSYTYTELLGASAIFLNYKIIIILCMVYKMFALWWIGDAEARYYAKTGMHMCRS